MRVRPTAILTIGLSLVVGACGGGDSATTTGGSGAAGRPSLQVTRPHPGTHTTAAAITVSGDATDAVRVTVAGTPSTLRPGPGAQRLFSARVPLRPGANRIVVVASSGTGTARTTLRVVRDRRQRAGRTTTPNGRAPASRGNGSSPGSTQPQGGPTATTPAPPQGGPPAQFAPPQGGPPAQSPAPPQGGTPAPSPPQGAPPAQGGGG